MEEGNILCPIDFSEASVKALDVAITLARKEKKGVTVLYSFRLIPPSNNEGVFSFKKQMERIARENFERLEPHFNTGEVVDHKFVVEIGFFADNITGHVKSNAVSMVVMDNGMYRRINDLDRHSDSLFATYHIPVVVVPGLPDTANSLL